jgi:hypothetical protein
MPKLVNGKVPRPWMGAGASAGTSPAKQQASNRFSAWIRESRAWIRSGINSITSPGYSAALQDASSRVSSWMRDSRAWFRSSFTLPASAGKNPPAAQQQAGPQFPGASQKASKRSPLPRFSDASGPGFALAGSMVRTIVKEGLSRSVASVVAGIFGATVTMVLLFTAAEMGVPMLMMDEGNMILQWFAAGGGFLASLVAGVCVAAVRPQYRTFPYPEPSLLTSFHVAHLFRPLLVPFKFRVWSFDFFFFTHQRHPRMHYVWTLPSLTSLSLLLLPGSRHTRDGPRDFLHISPGRKLADATWRRASFMGRPASRLREFLPPRNKNQSANPVLAQTHKHTSTQAHKHTSTQAHKHTSTQAHKHSIQYWYAGDCHDFRDCG